MDVNYVIELTTLILLLGKCWNIVWASVSEHCTEALNCYTTKALPSKYQITARLFHKQLTIMLFSSATKHLGYINHI